MIIMIQIMIVCIQLYSSLSLLARQSMLMLTELPEMFRVSNFSTLNTVTVILVTSMVIPELRGITTVYLTHRVQHLKHSWHWTRTHSVCYGSFTDFEFRMIKSIQVYSYLVPYISPFLASIRMLVGFRNKHHQIMFFWPLHLLCKEK